MLVTSNKDTKRDKEPIKTSQKWTTKIIQQVNHFKNLEAETSCGNLQKEVSNFNIFKGHCLQSILTVKLGYTNQQ